MKKALILTAVIMCSVLILSFSAAPAYAEHATPNGSTSIGYHLYTDDGYYYVPMDTVVGYGNTVSGDYVRAAQAALTYIHNHYYVSCDPQGIDGSFGPNTYNAVRAYQAYEGITVDGYVGNDTWTCMDLLC